MFKYFNTPTLKPANLVLFALVLLVIDYLFSIFTGHMTALNTVTFCLVIAFAESFYPSNKPKDIE
jgi:hypothetical protein